MKKIILLFTFLCLGMASNAQHTGIGAKGGLLVGTQQGKRPLISYHADLFAEFMGKWQGENVQRRLGMVIQLGYHRRGASYNTGFFGTTQSFVASDVFHNFSLAVLLKGNFKLKNNFLPYYCAGVRLDITPGANFAQVINNFDEAGVQLAMFGFYLGGGIEWEPLKLPFGVFLEINVSPDVTPQIFYPKGQQVVYYPYGSSSQQSRFLDEDYKIINVSIEVTFGVKFLLRKKVEPAEEL